MYYFGENVGKGHGGGMPKARLFRQVWAHCPVCGWWVVGVFCLVWGLPGWVWGNRGPAPGERYAAVGRLPSLSQSQPGVYKMLTVTVNWRPQMWGGGGGNGRPALLQAGSHRACMSFQVAHTS